MLKELGDSCSKYLFSRVGSVYLYYLKSAFGKPVHIPLIMEEGVQLKLGVDATHFLIYIARLATDGYELTPFYSLLNTVFP